MICLLTTQTQGNFSVVNYNKLEVNLTALILVYFAVARLQQGIPDDCDEFGEFRLRVADLIKDCVFIVGSANCFSQVR